MTIDAYFNLLLDCTILMPPSVTHLIARLTQQKWNPVNTKIPLGKTASFALDPITSTYYWFLGNYFVIDIGVEGMDADA